MVELIPSPAILDHIRETTAAGIETMKGAFFGGAIVDALRKGSPPWSWQVAFFIYRHSCPFVNDGSENFKEEL